MTKKTVGGPFGEAHFGHQIGAQPVRGLGRLDASGKRTAAGRSLVEQLGKSSQFSFVESGADRSRIPQRAVGVVVADEQRAKVLPGLPRVGVSADDKLLFVD